MIFLNCISPKKNVNFETDTEWYDPAIVSFILVTENPTIAQTFLTLTETTVTTRYRVMAPANSSGGSPQGIVWTNNVRVEEFSAHFDASFNILLPILPTDFYINSAGTKVGIINGGIRLEWKRGISLFAHTEICYVHSEVSSYLQQYVSLDIIKRNCPYCV